MTKRYDDPDDRILLFAIIVGVIVFAASMVMTLAIQEMR